MSHSTLAHDVALDASTSISRREWLHMRAYFREKDQVERKGTSAGRRKRNQHRMGRPPKSRDEKAVRWVVYLPGPERNYCQKLAKKAGVSPGEWLRSLISSAL